MLCNPLDTARKLELGINDAGYFLVIEDRDPNLSKTHLQFGAVPTTVALFMGANDVTHFDYHDTLFNDSDATESFIRCATAVGFAA